jgi:ubiquinone/menaquinone biosynthesis C-methylase UbiE
VSRRHRQQWETLGSEDPYWAVLTDPAKKNDQWDREEFFRTGELEIESLLRRIYDVGIALNFGIALDYGCGVGRLTRALASRFAQVIGVDFSAAMLAEAQAANATIANLQFLSNRGDDLPGIGDHSIDLVYSNIVLQHSPRKIQRALLAEFCRVLKPGGVLVFQTPSHPNTKTLHGFFHRLFGNGVLNVARRLRYGAGRVMEMHTLEKSEVLRILQDEGLETVHVERFDTAGVAFVSYRYFARKSGEI